MDCRGVVLGSKVKLDSNGWRTNLETKIHRSDIIVVAAKVLVDNVLIIACTSLGKEEKECVNM